MIDITRDSIDVSAVIRAVSAAEAGAVVLFLGTTREFTAGKRTVSLDYECYVDMAREKLVELEADACRRWPIVQAAIVHRIGRVPVGEASVAIAVSCPHREHAFAAGQWLIDSLKRVVPIWKCENWEDGTRTWVHPGSGHDAMPTDSRQLFAAPPAVAQPERQVSG